MGEESKEILVLILRLEGGQQWTSSSIDVAFPPLLSIYPS